MKIYIVMAEKTANKRPFVLSVFDSYDKAVSCVNRNEEDDKINSEFEFQYDIIEETVF